MKLWLLSHLRGSPGNALFLEAALARGHQAVLVNPEDCHLDLNAGRVLGPELPDLVFTRMGSSAPPHALDVLRGLEHQGLRCINPSRALVIARDKLRTQLALARAGLPLPPTLALGAKTPAALVEEILGPAPWVLKLPVSTQGMGVARVDSLASLRTLHDVFGSLGQRLLLQRFVPEAAGTDVRVLVVGGRALAAMRRRGAPGEWRSNLHRGGTGEGVEVTPELANLAERAASELGLVVAGVDLLPAAQGHVLLEVNGSPGLEGLSRATGRDLAGEVVSILESLHEEGTT